MDIRHLKELIQIFKESGLETMTIKEKNGTELTLNKERTHHYEASHGHHHKRESMIAKLVHETPTRDNPLITGGEENLEIDLKKCVKSPMVGTFFTASAPGKNPFAEVGKIVKKGDPLCIVEAMKVMNEIVSDRDGVIKKILVEDGTPVEFGQALFIVE